jgi:hypothetical protein
MKNVPRQPRSGRIQTGEECPSATIPGRNRERMGKQEPIEITPLRVDSRLFAGYLNLPFLPVRSCLFILSRLYPLKKELHDRFALELIPR